MRPTTLLRAAHVRQPMIHFLGKRSNIEKTPHTPKPHPQAPKEVVESFDAFLAKLKSEPQASATPSSSPSSKAQSAAPSTSTSSGKSGVPVDFEVFYEAPSRLWRTKPLEEFEMEAVMSGGATNVSA
ncbi:hypothetical protein NliqN6_0548 [Naganishia liquefaciens]|uniref:Uncharacterized protein n=1 Tax=Naganishia liquefaciens TaxID=104408 RepID=A0A8H3YDV1_9TREE|nr:hypothetical protein NliqN6_0548 [Naganishia liquefaciens]